MPKYTKPYIDSSVWLGWKNKEVRGAVNRYTVFQSIWEAAERGEFKLYTSAMTLAEVYKLRHESVLNPVAAESLLADFEEPWVEIIELDRDLGTEANRFCREFSANKLYPNDSLHLASALRVPCDYLLAYDRPLNSVAHSKITIANPEPIPLPLQMAQQVFDLG